MKTTVSVNENFDYQLLVAIAIFIGVWACMWLLTIYLALYQWDWSGDKILKNIILSEASSILSNIFSLFFLENHVYNR